MWHSIAVTMLLKVKHHIQVFKYQMQIAESANSVDLDQVAHKEPPHLDLHCLPSSP